MSNVEQLKAEGNALHAERRYAEACQKYSAAIAEKPDKATLAILYANRAASFLDAKKFLDALNDADEATKLDPTYAKAWSRVASAAFELGHLTKSKTAWTKGLACLQVPDAKLSPATRKTLKLQCEGGLAKVEAAQRTKPGIEEYMRPKLSRVADIPSVRAFRLLQQNKLKRSPVPSSGFVVYQASLVQLDVPIRSVFPTYYLQQHFENGLMCMQNYATRPQTGAVSHITDAILCDKRVFLASVDFFTKLESQMEYETRYFKAWGPVDTDRIKTEIVRRLDNSSWDVVYPALATSVGLWLIAAFLDNNMGKPLSAVENCKRAIDVLEWGAQHFKDARGDIFKPTFLRAVRRLYMPMAMWMYMKDGGWKSGYSLDDFTKMATDLKAETETSIPSPPDLKEVDPGSYAANHVYPIAEAYACFAWIHRQRAFAKKDKKEFSTAARFYMRAAEAYPEDEEERPFLLYSAAEMLWQSKSPLRLTLPVCRRIRDSMATADTIWGGTRGGAASNRAENCQKAIGFLLDCERKIAEGTLSLDDTKVPPFI
ncbi:hypothetical protein C8F01DRAFT_1362514 [Mycena amicta]|nr:hypothetical protein C8F01DRAFT_1362514 [Mycena amicta]